LDISLSGRNSSRRIHRRGSHQKNQHDPGWLNEHSFEPFTFHYTFFDAGIALRIDFKFESEALAFADQFSGIGAYLARAVGPASPGGLEQPAKVSEGRPASDS
jgi:hypothetical protein